MEQSKIAEFLNKNESLLFPNKKYSNMDIENALLSAPDSFANGLDSIPLKKPSTLQIISFLPYGIDRFYLGDIKYGILKLITYCGFGIWWLVDIISARSRCREYNCKKLIEAVNDPTVIEQMNNANDKIKQAGNVAKIAANGGKRVLKSLKNVRNTMDIDP